MLKEYESPVLGKLWVEESLVSMAIMAGPRSKKVKGAIHLLPPTGQVISYTLQFELEGKLAGSCPLPKWAHYPLLENELRRRTKHFARMHGCKHVEEVLGVSDDRDVFYDVYLSGDQPTTCPKCSARTEFKSNPTREVHKCIDDVCAYRFVVRHEEGSC